MRLFEMPNFAKGTISIFESIANLEDATTIIGGGDSAAAAIQLGYAEKFSHISTDWRSFVGISGRKGITGRKMLFLINHVDADVINKQDTKSVGITFCYVGTFFV